MYPSRLTKLFLPWGKKGNKKALRDREINTENRTIRFHWIEPHWFDERILFIYPHPAITYKFLNKKTYKRSTNSRHGSRWLTERISQPIQQITMLWGRPPYVTSRVESSEFGLSRTAITWQRRFWTLRLWEYSRRNWAHDGSSPFSLPQISPQIMFYPTLSHLSAVKKPILNQL